MTESAPQAPLEDLMAAMDVVDTLRHEQRLVDQELDADGRRERLLERLRNIYKGQGIEVSDAVLMEGIEALEQERFKYQPHPKTFGIRLAHWYVRRGRWGKPLLALVMMIVVLFSGYYFAEVRPQQQARKAFPQQLQRTFSEISTVAKNPTVVKQARETLDSAQAALNNDKQSVATELLQTMEDQLAGLRQYYQIRVVSRPGELSGVWRVANINTAARNYYLIVEAVDTRGNILSLPITSEEDGKRKIVKKWGLRVDQRTFERIANDKRDDGIIQQRLVGEKPVGELAPVYRISTSGAAITNW